MSDFVIEVYEIEKTERMDMVIASNSQLDCHHVIGVSTRGHVAHLIYQDDKFSDVGMVAFDFCPFCGFEFGGLDERKQYDYRP
jgi:hypothetical protein